MKAFNFFELVLGVFLGWVLTAALAYTAPNSYYSVVIDAKTKCEQNLPRNQQCVIVAVPKEKK